MMSTNINGLEDQSTSGMAFALINLKTERP